MNLQHFEDAHRMESDMEEEDDLPFEFDDLSSNRNNSNENYLPTLTDLFLKDLEAKQRHMEENNLLGNGMGIQNSIAMSDIYSEDKKVIDPVTTLAGNTNATFSDILNNKNASANSNTNLSHLTNLSRTNSASSMTSKFNNPMNLNIPNTTTSTSTTHITTPSSATTSNFNLSKNISAFNNAVSGNTSNLFNKSGSSSNQQTPTLSHTTLTTSASTTSAATTATASAALAISTAAVNNLKNIQKLSTTTKGTSIQPAPVTTTAGMHPLFPNNPFALLNASGLKGVTPFDLINTNSAAKDQKQSSQQEFDDMDMDMDMDDANDMMNADAMLMAEAGPDEEKKYRCTVPGCNKSYKNPGGLKYHLQHGHFEDTGDPEMNRIMHKPFQCTYENCGKRYKNMNGLKYHIEHSHTSLFYNQQQGGIGQANVPLDSQQVLAFQALQMQQQQIQQQLQQLQHIN